MRFLALVAITGLTACNATVTVLEEPREDPEPLPKDDPKEPSAQCSTNSEHLSVTLTGSARGCRFGEGFSALFESVEPLGETGVRMVTSFDSSLKPQCTIDVQGVDPRIVDAFGPLGPGAPIQGVIEPHRIDFYQPMVCDLCVGCPCPAPLPLLFAGEGSVDQPVVSASQTAIIERSADLCSDSGTPCKSATYPLRAIVKAIDLGAPVAERELVRVEATEGESLELLEISSRLDVLRASGRSAACAGADPSLEVGTAVWALYSVFGYEL